METWLAGWISAVLTVMGGSPALPPPEESSFSVDYRCEAPTWPRPPKVGSDGMLRATLAASCELQATGGGGYPQLETYLIERVAQEAKQVHAGPLSETYQNLPSTFYDLTVELSGGDNKVIARQDVHIATDRSTQLRFDTFSKKMQGEGLGKYVKKTDILTTIVPTQTPGLYSLRFSTDLVVEKPGFIPTRLFESEFKSRTEANLPKIEKKLIEDIAPHL